VPFHPKMTAPKSFTYGPSKLKLSLDEFEIKITPPPLKRDKRKGNLENTLIKWIVDLQTEIRQISGADERKLREQYLLRTKKQHKIKHDEAMFVDYPTNSLCDTTGVFACEDEDYNSSPYRALVEKHHQESLAKGIYIWDFDITELAFSKEGSKDYFSNWKYIPASAKDHNGIYKTPIWVFPVQGQTTNGAVNFWLYVFNIQFPQKIWALDLKARGPGHTYRQSQGIMNETCRTALRFVNRSASGEVCNEPDVITPRSILVPSVISNEASTCLAFACRWLEILSTTDDPTSFYKSPSASMGIFSQERNRRTGICSVDERRPLTDDLEWYQENSLKRDVLFVSFDNRV
jgi:hypothetical protein